jgi:DNA-binding transcriptional regulator YiaG
MNYSIRNLPALIVRWRLQRNLTQADAARHLGVPIGSIRNWEQGRTTPKGLALIGLLACLDHEPGWLVAQANPVVRKSKGRRKTD